MAEIGKKGGKVTSQAKRDAALRNLAKANAKIAGKLVEADKT